MVELFLLELHPRFLAEGRHRYGQGVEFDCPTHRAPCRLQFWFAAPDDGMPGKDDTPLYRHAYREGSLPFASLSLWRRQLVGVARHIDVPGHWKGVVMDGVVWSAP